jgi:hypothetical protein
MTNAAQTKNYDAFTGTTLTLEGGNDLTLTNVFYGEHYSVLTFTGTNLSGKATEWEATLPTYEVENLLEEYAEVSNVNLHTPGFTATDANGNVRTIPGDLDVAYATIAVKH